MSYFKPLSFWEYDTWFSQVDIAIIGGGIVGMQAALRLKEVRPKSKIAILERASIGTAASSRNAGFACFGSPSEILTDLQNMPASAVQDLVRKRIKGLQLLRAVVGDHDLRYEQTGGHEVFVEQSAYEYHLDHLDEVNRLLADVDKELVYAKPTMLHAIQDIAGMLSNQWEGQIHPGHMTQALRRQCHEKGIKILNNIEVEGINGSNDFEIKTNHGSIKSSKVIVCNNAFAKELVDLKTTGVRNQVLVTAPIADLKLKGCYHLDSGYVYFRNIGNRILIGGGRNMDEQNETTDKFGHTDLIQTYLRKIVSSHLLPNTPYDIEYQWSGILGFNETKQPIVKEIGTNLFVAVGLGGMGVAIGSLVGREVADLLLQS